MSLTNEFKNVVETGKTTRAKIMMKDSLLLDPSCVSFNEMLKYAQENIPDIIDIHNGEVLKKVDQWDENYLNEQMVNVVSNFSQERIDLLNNMVKELYFKSTPVNESKHDSNSHKTGLNRMQGTGVAVAVIGAGVLLVGLGIADVPIAVPIIGGIALGMGALIFFMNK